MTRSTLTRRRLLTATAPALTRVEIQDGRITAADPQARTITGVVATWGAVGRTSAGPARFARGSITASDPRRVKLLIEHDSERVVGYLTGAQETETGLTATFVIPAGAAGDAVLASAAAGLRDGLSVGVEVTAAAPGADGTLEVTAGDWRETSVVAIPAYQSARVTQVAASDPGTPSFVPGQFFAQQASQTPAAVAPAGPAAGPFPQAFAPVAAAWHPNLQAARPRDPDAVVETMVERIVAGWRSGGSDGALRAALTDIVPPAAGGATQPARDALFRPQWLGELWQTAYTQRDLIDSISHAPLNSFTVTGFRVQRPVFGVQTYAGNKAAVPSPGGYTVVPVSANARRVAGAHDVDRAFVDLGDGSFVSSYFRYQAENYAVLTETETAAALVAGATPLVEGVGGTPDSVLAALDALAAYFSRLGGARLSFVAIAGDLWSELIGIKQLDAPWLFGGSASLQEGTATVGGIRLFAQPTLQDGLILAGDRRAATHYEWKNPPLAVQAQNIAQGGVDLGVFGYHTELINNPDALVKVGVSSTDTVADEPARKGK